MPRTKEALNEILNARVKSAPRIAQQLFREAAEIIVFGSMAAGLDRLDSDIDVLCIGGSNYTLKSRLLDLIVVPLESITSQRWLESELATHVVQYGTWTRGIPNWKKDARVGQSAIDAKRRRISAFLGSLETSWLRLQDCFRSKYSIKLRRETQRLILLERNLPVPPTKILDDAKAVAGDQMDEVCERLRELSRETSSRFLEEFIGRIQAYSDANEVPGSVSRRVD